MLAGKLEIALGLETVRPVVLPRLNKQMTVEDFQRAVRFLSENEIATRAFILLRPPFLSETEGIEWALRSLERGLEQGLAIGRGRVFVDLWDAERFFGCRRCGPARRDRLARMNLSRQPLPAVSCDCEAR